VYDAWENMPMTTSTTTRQDLHDRIDGRNLATRYLANVERNGSVEVLRWKDANGAWQSSTLNELTDLTARLVTGLEALGDRVRQQEERLRRLEAPAHRKTS
jgi:hypothetical protein